MDQEEYRSTETPEAPRRRRRRSERLYGDDGLPVYGEDERTERPGTESPAEAPGVIREAAAEKKETAAESETGAPEEGPREPAGRPADSRIPPEARRMTAAPYGEAGAAHKRPGMRPMQAERRPAAERTPIRMVRRPVRPAPAPTPAGEGETRSFNTAGVYGAAAEERNNEARVSVGYAPGRMSLPPREPRTAYGARDWRDPRDPRAAAAAGREPERGLPGKPARMGQGARNTRGAQDPWDPRKGSAEKAGRTRKHPLLAVLAGVLVVIGILIGVLQLLPKDSGVRQAAEGIAKTVTKPVESLLGQQEEPAKILAFSVTGNEKVTAPADVLFTVTTDTAVKELRLTDEDGMDLEAASTLVENTDSNLWTLTFPVRDGYEGLVKLQTRKAGGEWADTECTAAVAIAPPLAGTDNTATPEPQEIPGSPAGEAEAAGDAEAAADAGDPATDEAGENPEDFGDEMWGTAWGETRENEAESTPETTPEPTATPEPTPEPTPTPPLEAAADPSADPSEMFTSYTIYEGSKKQKSYVRPAKMMIHMPDGDDYTPQKIGVLTFRGNAFRQNAAVGEIASAEGLSQIWAAEAGSAKGASQTFYGYEWTGQPAIVKWSSQVRAESNIDEDKKTKKALREVIIAGSDGVIRFLDLEDGVPTRDAINVKYPMRGTPSLHPAGYPYMNVGQYTRKMKTRTGSIGLRQFNLYNQKEQKLIDGLDGKLHRGLNRVGSFETSALIDRNSDTMVTLGTNGLLYLVHLGTSFDYKAATLSLDSSTVVLASRAKGEKKNELVAVESSHAMYDRYVFYADMGGVLRCVDTNFLTTTWAVNTEDAVMASVALDLRDRELDLYTANMLKNRKKGNAQIRKYDALSGKELWKVEIGVAKNTKTKEDVGVKASPVIGQQGLGELVYFTVTGLNEEGRTTLGADEETKAALVALEKETGRIRWSRGLSDRSESSPVAVYDAEGKGYIIQCAEDGTILLLDGLNGEEKASLKLEAKIQASPAVYNDILVIGTTGKGTESVVGIRIQ